MKQRRAPPQWMERWKKLQEILASPVQNLQELAEDPQAWENDYFMEAYCEEVQRQVKIRVDCRSDSARLRGRCGAWGRSSGRTAS